VLKVKRLNKRDRFQLFKMPEKISSAVFNAASSVTRMQILRLLAAKGPLS
jgi:predicted transcriptional regulator